MCNVKRAKNASNNATLASNRHASLNKNSWARTGCLAAHRKRPRSQRSPKGCPAHSGVCGVVSSFKEIDLFVHGLCTSNQPLKDWRGNCPHRGTAHTQRAESRTNASAVLSVQRSMFGCERAPPQTQSSSGARLARSLRYFQCQNLNSLLQNVDLWPSILTSQNRPPTESSTPHQHCPPE